MDKISTYYTVEDAYANTLSDVYHYGVRLPNGNIELINCNFIIDNLDENILDKFNIQNKFRKFNNDKGIKYYETLLSGKGNIVGARIITQLPYIVEELIEYPMSRRAVLNILETEDKEVLRNKRSGLTNKEYPHIISQTFWIRDDKLHSLVHMRSNNVVKPICYDLYNFIHLQHHLLWRLNDIRITPLTLGSYHHNIVNAHIKKKDIELSKNILQEYNINSLPTY